MIFADVRPMIASAMEGFNTCVLAYGQTGSGKTYTMEGPVQDPGIHFRAVKDMFDMRSGHKSVRSYDFSISVLEVHNERVFDLLVDPRTAAERRKTRHDLPIKVDVVRGVAVEGLTEFPVESVQSMVETIELAAGNRAQGVTSANEHSSRSHLIITIGVRGQALATGKKWHGKLHLVDLAGSERLGGGAGMRAEESRMINKSLSALHDVFTALKQREKHIPYRNSKLTQLLQDSLAGNSKVLMMLTISPRRADARESTSSLTLAKRVKSIVLGGAKREVENKEYIKISEGHERQVEELRGRISALEAQLRNALGAAKQNADDKSRKVSM
jgi:kinesin family protein C2/C3